MRAFVKGRRDGVGMSFDYNKNKSVHSGDSFWTSYSDLFLGLSTIFLLLYVVASLRAGTDQMQTQVDNQKLSMKVQELESQLKMYEQVKADYLEKSASKDEMQEYTELMDKLTLLKDEAKNDQEKLARQALENENKGQALNKYQQMIRNIINANKVAKTKLITRNDIIDEQGTTIEGQKTNIDTLEQDVTKKQRLIEANDAQIKSAQAALSQAKRELLASYKHNKLTKKQFEARQRQITQQSEAKINDLQSANAGYSSQISSLSTELSASKADTAKAKSEAGAIKEAFERDKAAARAALDREIAKGKLDAAERGRREAALRADGERKEAEMRGKLSGLEGRLKDTEGALAKAREEMDARRDVAREIKKGFAAAGVKADVDMQTGEVVLDFGDAYFESDSANLKPQMRDVIERAMPVYSKSLFGNRKVADKISNVEIVGYASPTYKGRFVDPHSDKAEDKAALKYNMDLSYRRANSIFGYLVNNRDGSFDHQQDLLALMKVSGRSFLEVMKVKGRAPTSAADFCKVNDCKKAQKVIVRFSMDGKK